MRIGALFAGMGGLDLAVESVFGATPAWFSEFEAAPSRILAQRFPGVPNYGDVTKIDWASVEPVDIITGGSPCQDLSHAGKRQGMKAGTRSGLWASMCDAIETIRPRFVVWENVRGALSAEADSAVEPCPICVGDGRGVTLRALGRVLGDLAELGYDASWVGLRAADVGAPHGRFRVFVLAWDAAAYPDGSAGSERWLAAPGQAESRRARSDAGGRDRASSPEVTLLPTPAVNDMGRAYTPDEWDAWTAKMKGAHGNGNGHGKSLEIEAQRLLPTPRATRGGSGTETMYGLGAERSDENRAQGQVLLPTPRATDGTKGGPNQRGSSGDLMMPAAVQPERFGDYAPAIARWEAVLGRPAPAPTEPTGKGGAHRLSPRFVEFMMGLPDGWVTDTDTTRNEQLKALGNGVVPQQAAAALRHLLTTI